MGLGGFFLSWTTREGRREGGEGREGGREGEGGRGRGEVGGREGGREGRGRREGGREGGRGEGGGREGRGRREGGEREGRGRREGGEREGRRREQGRIIMACPSTVASLISRSSRLGSRCISEFSFYHHELASQTSSSSNTDVSTAGLITLIKTPGPFTPTQF